MEAAKTTDNQKTLGEQLEALEAEGGNLAPDAQREVLGVAGAAPKKSIMEKLEPTLDVLDVVAFSNLPEMALNKFIGAGDKQRLFTTALSFYREMRSKQLAGAGVNA